MKDITYITLARNFSDLSYYASEAASICGEINIFNFESLRKQYGVSYIKNVRDAYLKLLSECTDGMNEAINQLRGSTENLSVLKTAREPVKYWKGKRGEYRCPDCGEEAPNNGYYPSNFCPRCGVRFGDPEEKE